MIKYLDWSKKSPPTNTWVWATYQTDNLNNHEHWQLLKTCKKGCCVHSSIGTMALPKLWYLATLEEGMKEESYWKHFSTINSFDLYTD